MKTFIKPILLITLFTVIISSCKKKTSEPQETITTVKLILTGTSGNVVATWKDTDGAGGNNPVFDTLVIDTNQSYTGKIEVWDESQTPALNITEEIEKEKNIHQFFYTPSNALYQISGSDKDDNGIPIGLNYLLTTNKTTGLSELRIVLSHYDGVVKTTAPSNESDIDITIPVKLK